MSSYHTLFYSRILGPLKNLRYDTDEAVESIYHLPEVNFVKAYEPHAPNGYPHNYQLHKFLATRKRIVIANKRSEDFVAVLAEDKRAKVVIIYKKAIEHLFPDDSEKALQELKNLMQEFYEVIVEERSELSKVDLNEGRHPNHHRINELRSI